MDDTYIHMAMAKSFSGYGVWGTTRYGFTSSTSSPFYTLILAACYLITGVHEITPLMLNLAAGAALLFWCDFLFARAGIDRRWRFYLLAILVFAIPLPILILGGMEHTLHALLTLVFVHLSCLLLTNSGAAKTSDLFLLLILSAILVMTRYEAAFLVAAAGAMFLWRGKWAITLGLALGSAGAIGGYGAISMMHGWFPLPTSLLLKANLPSTVSSGMYPGFLQSLFRNVSHGSHVAILLLIGIGLLYRSYRTRGTVWTYNGVGLILFATSALMHLALGRTGWFFRYEAYLVAFGIVVDAVSLWEVGLPHPRMVWIGAGVLLGGLLTARMIYAFSVAPQAIVDIYDQQYQMGLLARQNLGGKTLLINDIGAVSFLSDAKVIDLIGLGSLDPALARVHHQYSFPWLEQWVERSHASAAIIYPNLAPPEWKPLSTWTIPGNYMSGNDSVEFFALDPAFRAALVSDLQRFRGQLPARVVVR